MSQTGSYFSSEVTFRILIQRVRFGLGGAARKGASSGWTLETLQNMALEQHFACTVVFLGGGSNIREILENVDLSQYGYVKDIPESQYVSAPDGGSELYCIVGFYVEFTDGSTISAYGTNSFPPHYQEVYSALWDLTAPAQEAYELEHPEESSTL